MNPLLGLDATWYFSGLGTQKSAVRASQDLPFPILNRMGGLGTTLIPKDFGGFEQCHVHSMVTPLGYVDRRRLHWCRMHPSIGTLVLAMIMN